MSDELEKPLWAVRTSLKSGDYDGVDIMRAWLTIDRVEELEAENKWIKKHNLTCVDKKEQSK